MTAPAAGAALRIAHVVTNGEFAGTERYVLDVSRVLAERGHAVTVIGGRPGPMRQQVSPAVDWRPGADAATAVRALLRLGAVDVVHSHVAKSDFVSVLAGPVSRGVRVSTRHITARRGYSPTARRLAGVVRRRLSCEIAVSRWTSEQLERPADTILLNGVLDRPLSVLPRERTVFVAQRLAPEKDTATAIRAWELSGLAAQGWTLVIAGSGAEHAGLQRLADSTSGGVRFLGWLDDPSPVFARCGMFLAPAPTEPCGLTVLEAMSHGAPVVAAGSGGHLETVGSHPDAALFPAGDVAAAAAQLVRLAADDDARAAYGLSLHHLQRSRFSLSGHVTALESIYRSTRVGAHPSS